MISQFWDTVPTSKCSISKLRWSYKEFLGARSISLIYLMYQNQPEVQRTLQNNREKKSQFFLSIFRAGGYQLFAATLQFGLSPIPTFRSSFHATTVSWHSHRFFRTPKPWCRKFQDDEKGQQGSSVFYPDFFDSWILFCFGQTRWTNIRTDSQMKPYLRSRVSE